MLGVGSFLVGKIDHISPQKIAVTVASTGIPMLFPVFYPLSTPSIVLPFLMHEIGRGAIRPLLFTYSNDHINDHIRSTTNSLQSAFRMVGAAVGLLSFGYLSEFEFISPVLVWAVAASVLVLLALYAMLHKE